MDIRTAFLDTSRTVLQAFVELASYRATGLTAKIAFLSVNATDRETYANSQIPAVLELKKIGPRAYYAFDILFQDSSIVFSYSWLDTYLAELEEALYLHDPMSLGERVEVKLGKILSSNDIPSLVHEIARKKVKEKSGWGLKNRIHELQKTYAVVITTTESDLEWLSEIRNNIAHNRRLGEFSTGRKKVAYRALSARHPEEDETVLRFLGLVFSVITQLYLEGSRVMGVTAKFPKHRSIVKHLAAVKKAFPLVV